MTGMLGSEFIQARAQRQLAQAPATAEEQESQTDQEAEEWEGVSGSVLTGWTGRTHRSTQGVRGKGKVKVSVDQF